MNKTPNFFGVTNEYRRTVPYRTDGRRPRMIGPFECVVAKALDRREAGTYCVLDVASGVRLTGGYKRATDALAAAQAVVDRQSPTGLAMAVAKAEKTTRKTIAQARKDFAAAAKAEHEARKATPGGESLREVKP